ncbi:MAG: N-acetylmuramoyl-L-alanine amidase LytC [Fimbriimonadaceae bacterium]|nr:N-acetylmuramoyl-L-alanine amidase LytC [Fimbriimonadaceae bacterium]
MGLQLAHEPDGIHLTLIKPNVGDGKLAGKVVVVDAGHGGHDTGARSPDKKLNEKDLALAIASVTAKRLSEQGATVVLTRKGDQFIALKERSEIANRNGAHFFLSVHINSNQVANSSTGGITFYHQQDPVGMLLADCIQGEIAKVSGLPNLGTWSDRRIYETGFAVLRYAKMPAVLIEMGFINNAKDRARMSTADFKEKVAGAIVQGLRAYLGDGKQED